VNNLVNLTATDFVVAFAEGRDHVQLRRRSRVVFGVDDVVLATARAPGREMHRAVLAALPDTPIAVRTRIVKVMRRALREALEKDCFEALPADAARWARAAIGAESKGYDHVDSQRAARVDRSSQLRRFVRSRTCCGSHEWHAVGPDGRRYVLGFNYGH
jgi:hypothetical protein